jgi:hypothetical protein
LDFGQKKVKISEKIYEAPAHTNNDMSTTVIILGNKLIKYNDMYYIMSVSHTRHVLHQKGRSYKVYEL